MPRAISSIVMAVPQVWESSSAIRTRICTAPAWAADPVLSRTPTKAPGSVTRPTVLVESRLGSKALVADCPMISIRESRSLRPRLSAASTSPARTFRVSSAKRAATATAVMVLPSTMATIGTTATPVSGTTPESNSRGSRRPSRVPGTPSAWETHGWPGCAERRSRWRRRTSPPRRGSTTTTG